MLARDGHGEAACRGGRVCRPKTPKGLDDGLDVPLRCWRRAEHETLEMRSLLAQRLHTGKRRGADACKVCGNTLATVNVVVPAEPAAYYRVSVSSPWSIVDELTSDCTEEASAHQGNAHAYRVGGIPTRHYRRQATPEGYFVTATSSLEWPALCKTTGPREPR